MGGFRKVAICKRSPIRTKLASLDLGLQPLELWGLGGVLCLGYLVYDLLL